MFSKHSQKPIQVKNLMTLFQKSNEIFDEQVQNFVGKQYIIKIKNVIKINSTKLG